MGRDLFLRAARGERTERPPVWLMRQAGRYLPEYRAIRADHSFVEAISTPAIAAEVSRQPYERFGVDGVVMYSDILTVLEPLGLSYHVESGVGPVIDDPIDEPGEIDRLPVDPPVAETLDYVGGVLDRLTATVEDAAIIGFAGGPFTLASYAVAGEATRSKMALRRLRASHPDRFRTLLERFADVVAEYVAYQAAHGADVIQLFETYGGLLGPADYETFLVPLHRRILDAVDVPTIAFARNLSGNLDLLAATGADVVGLDWTVEMGTAREQLGDRAVQGNLDPATLYGSSATIAERTEAVIRAAGPRGHILNLGHGVHKTTPVEGVATFVETAKNWSWDDA